MKRLLGFLAVALLSLSAPLLASPPGDSGNHSTLTVPDSTAAPSLEPSATIVFEQPCEVRHERAVPGELRVALATCEVRATSDAPRDKADIDAPNPYASFLRFNRGRRLHRVMRC